jgi:23S rRNA (adenine2030-N6)-methyltransferase
MNYRHAFHAGNFADVFKHVVLARVIAHLLEKPSPFRVIDTHAGAGRYSLAGAEASRTGEWRDGIGRLVAADLEPPVRALLAPYLSAVAAENADGRLVRYPGSPVLVQHWLRQQDRLIACELEPGAAAGLARNLDGDPRAKAIAIDGWTALAAYLPPKERRGVVLVDPPFEKPEEFGHLVRGLATAHRRWATGTYILWYPVKDLPQCNTFLRRLAESRIPRLLRAQLHVAPAGADRLSAAGVIVVNPPWKLHAQLTLLLPALVGLFTRSAGARFHLDWLTSEK